MMTSTITGSHDFRQGNQREGRGFIWRLRKDSVMLIDHESGTCSEDSMDVEEYLPVSISESDDNSHKSEDVISLSGETTSYAPELQSKRTSNIASADEAVIDQGKAFDSSDALKSYINEQEGELYRGTLKDCPHCECKAKGLIGLKEHIRLEHKGPLPYACGICNKNYILIPALVKHIQNKHQASNEEIKGAFVIARYATIPPVPSENV